MKKNFKKVLSKQGFAKANGKKGQISVEYLIVIGFVVFIVISILGVAFFYSSGIRDRIKVNQITDFGNKLVSAAESVYYSGEPSKLTVTAYLPARVEGIEIVENDLIISLQTSNGVTDLPFSSNVPITGAITVNEGVKRIEVIAEEDGVLFAQ